jgi:hypothetical protein
MRVLRMGARDPSSAWNEKGLVLASPPGSGSILSVTRTGEQLKRKVLVGET